MATLNLRRQRAALMRSLENQYTAFKKVPRKAPFEGTYEDYRAKRRERGKIRRQKRKDLLLAGTKFGKACGPTELISYARANNLRVSQEAKDEWSDNISRLSQYALEEAITSAKSSGTGIVSGADVKFGLDRTLGI